MSGNDVSGSLASYVIGPTFGRSGMGSTVRGRSVDAVVIGLLAIRSATTARSWGTPTSVSPET